jgi:hypothetical protein
MRMHPFLYFLRNGKINFTKDGNIIIFNEGSFFIPVRVFNKILTELQKILGKRKTETFIKSIAHYQIEQALKRYIKIFGIDEVEKDKIQEFCMKIIELLGIGKPSIEKINEGFLIKFGATPFAKEYVLEYGKRKDRWDFYVEGLSEKWAQMLFGGKYECKEIKCYAKGDDCCLFEIKKIK